MCGPIGRTEGLVNRPLNLGALWTEVWSILGLWNWTLHSFEALELKISFKNCNLGVIGRLRTGKCWNGGLADGKKGMKRWSSGLHIPVPHFSGSAPLEATHQALDYVSWLAFLINWQPPNGPSPERLILYNCKILFCLSYESKVRFYNTWLLSIFVQRIDRVVKFSSEIKKNHNHMFQFINR